MRKNSVVDFVLAKKIVTAIMIFCQAVFLLPGGAHAELITRPSLSDVYVGAQVSGRVPFGVSVNAPVHRVRFDVYDSSSVKVRELFATSSSLYFISYLQTTSVGVGAYMVRAVALDTASVVIAETPQKQFSVTDDYLPVTLDFVSPAANATIGGATTLSIRSNDQNVAVSFYYRHGPGSTYVLFGSVPSPVSGMYSTSLDTSVLANGEYTFAAKASKNNAVVATKEISSVVYNAPVQEQTAPTSTPTEDVPTTTEPSIEAWMLEAPTSTVGQRPILARTNVVADFVNFIIDGPSVHRSYPGVFSSVSTYNNYSFIWDAQNYNPGTYTIRAEAGKNGEKVLSEPITIVKLAPVAATVDLKPATTTQVVATTSDPVINTQINIGSGAIAGVASGTVPLFAKTSSNIKQVEYYFEKPGIQELIGQAMFDEGRGYWLYKWTTNGLLDGPYNVLAIGRDAQGNKFFSNSLKINIANQLRPQVIATTTVKVATTSPITKPAMDSISQQATSTNVVAMPTAVKPIEPIKPSPTQEPILPVKPSYQAVQVPVKTPVAQLPESQGNTSTTQVTVIDKPMPAAPVRSLAADCQEAGISDTQRCELYRFSRIAIQACREENIASKQDCISLIRGKFGEPSICRQMTPEKCDQLFANVIVDKLVPQKQIDKASKALEVLVGKNIQFVGNDNKAATTSEQEILVKDGSVMAKLDSDSENAIIPVSPFAKNQGKVAVTVLAVAKENDSSESGVRAVLSIDSDSDGLSDDIEKRLGTSLDKADSDNDGFNDGDEVKTGHNPLGAGMLAGKLQPAEQALLNKATFEQPKSFGVADPVALKVEKVEISNIASSTNVRLAGKALPDQVFSLFIYSSLPIIVTVRTDQNGNWSYDLDKSLTDGKHEAYVVLNDEAGKIETKSAPFSFFVSEARAVSQDDLLKADVNVYNQTDTMLWWYASAGFILILFIAGLFFLYIRSKKATSLN